MATPTVSAELTKQLLIGVDQWFQLCDIVECMYLGKLLDPRMADLHDELKSIGHYYVPIRKISPDTRGTIRERIDSFEAALHAGIKAFETGPKYCDDFHCASPGCADPMHSGSRASTPVSDVPLVFANTYTPEQ